MAQNTPDFNYRPAHDALLEYQRVLNQLMDKSGGEKLMQDHVRYLAERQRYFQRQMDALSPHVETDEVSAVHYQNLSRKLERLHKASGTLHAALPKERVQNQNTHLMKTLRSAIRPVLEQLGVTGRPEDIDQSPAAGHSRELYEASRKETQDIFALLDKWYALGNEYAINHENSKNRSRLLSLMPMDIQYAKWEFMLSLVDSAYGLKLCSKNDGEGAQYDTREMKLLARMLATLSENERGAYNPHMAPAFKLRHNPSIHSLHVVSLLQKVFDDAGERISREVPQHERAAAEEYLATLRHELSFGALVHDMGEMEGEFSEMIRVQSKTPEEREKFEQERNAAEQRVFENNLDFFAKKVGYDDAQWAAKKPAYLTAFELPEQTDTFRGRLLKVVERVQSQQDYLRFQRLNKEMKLKGGDIPELHEPPIPKETMANPRKLAKFLMDSMQLPSLPKAEDMPALVEEYRMKNVNGSLTYVIGKLDGKAEPENKHEDSLAQRSQDEPDPIKRRVNYFITAAVHDEYTHLTTQHIPAYTNNPGFPQHIFYPGNAFYDGVVRGTDVQRGV